MTDTLFDLDALAPSVAPKADVEDVRLANQIASSATLATKAASDAIGLWGRSRAVAVDDPVLGGEFVDTVNSDRWRVANVGLRPDGDVVLRFVTSDPRQHAHVLVAARMASDGALVDFAGGRMIPAELVPAAATTVDDDCGLCLMHAMEAVRLVGRKGPWGRFRSLESRRDQREFVGLLSESVEIPASLLGDAGQPVADDVRRRLLEMHVARLSAQVAEIQAAPISQESISAAAGLLRANRRVPENMWLPVSVDDFLPEEAPTLAPLVDLFAWPMVTAEWEGNVSIDTSSGWRIAVSIDARHLTSGAVIETEIDMLGRDAAKLAEWFSPSARVDAAVRELERELKVLGRAQAAPVESATTAKRKPAKQPVADEESVNWLRNAIAFLKPLAVSADELAAVERASTIAATVRIDEPSIEEVRGFLGNAFQRLRADLLIEAERLLAVRVWTQAVINDAVRHLEFSEKVGGVVRVWSDAGTQVESLIESVQAELKVVEVVPGWWVSYDGPRMNQHGAVSSTGFYSGCGLVERAGGATNMDARALVAHLLDGAGGHDSLRSLFKSEECPSAFAAWLRGLRFAPEANAARNAAQYLTGLARTRSILSNIGKTVDALAAEGTTAVDAQSLYAALQHSYVADEEVGVFASIGQSLLAARFGSLDGRKPRVDGAELFETPAAAAEEEDGADDTGADDEDEGEE
jgi:hypothetical protein